MTKTHTTKVEPVGAGFKAVCTCGWESRVHATFEVALSGVRFHKETELIWVDSTGN